jgi:hypothetical protein
MEFFKGVIGGLLVMALVRFTLGSYLRGLIKKQEEKQKNKYDKRKLN